MRIKETPLKRPQITIFGTHFFKKAAKALLNCWGQASFTEAPGICRKKKQKATYFRFSKEKDSIKILQNNVIAPNTRVL